MTVNEALYSATTTAYALPNPSGLTRNTIPVQADAYASANDVPSINNAKNGQAYHIKIWDTLHNNAATTHYI